MPLVAPSRRTRSPWRFLLATLCVLLVVAAGTVQVAHVHADGPDTHADCSLCAAAHVTVQVVHTPASAPPVSVVSVIDAIPAPVTPSVLSTFALFTRPPPAV